MLCDAHRAYPDILASQFCGRDFLVVTRKLYVGHNNKIGFLTPDTQTKDEILASVSVHGRLYVLGRANEKVVQWKDSALATCTSQLTL